MWPEALCLRVVPLSVRIYTYMYMFIRGSGQKLPRPACRRLLVDYVSGTIWVSLNGSTSAPIKLLLVFGSKISLAAPSNILGPPGP